MNRKWVILVVLTVISTMLSGCNWFKPEPVDPVAVAEALATIQAPAFTPTPNWQATAEAIMPTATAVPVATPTVIATPMASSGCHVIHESLVDEGMDHVATSGDYIHLEYWWPGEPERETILPAALAAGGRFNFTRGLRGWVWEYEGCTFEEVRAQVDIHIDRRLAGGANNNGFVLWNEVGLFQPAQ